MIRRIPLVFVLVLFTLLLNSPLHNVVAGASPELNTLEKFKDFDKKVSALTQSQCQSDKEMLVEKETTISEVPEKVMESTPTFRDMSQVLRASDVPIILGTGPCVQTDSIDTNDSLPQIVLDESGCQILIDFRVKALREYKYVLIFLEGDVTPELYPYVMSFSVGQGNVGSNYSMIALELPNEVSGGLVLDIAGGFPTTHPLRTELLEHLREILSLNSIGVLADQIIGVWGVNQEVIEVLTDVGYLSVEG